MTDQTNAGAYTDVSWLFAIEFADENGDPVDMTGDYELSVYRYAGEPVPVVVFSTAGGQLDGSQASDGILKINAAPADHGVLSPGTWVWHLNRVDLASPQWAATGHLTVAPPGGSETTFEVAGATDGSMATATVIGLPGPGVPAGGAAGQVLAKIDAGDRNTHWIDPAAGGGEANTASNVGTAGIGLFKDKSGVDLRFRKLKSQTLALALAENPGDDQVDLSLDIKDEDDMASDSATALVSQQSVKAYVDAHDFPAPGILTNSDVTDEYISPLGMTYGVNTSTVTANRKYFQIFEVPFDFTATELAFHVSGAGAANSVARLGIREYTASGTNYGTFGPLVVDGGEIAVDSTGLKKLTISTALTRGRYAFEFVSDGAPALYAQLYTFYAAPQFGMRQTTGIAYPVLSVYRAYTYAALPTIEAGTLADQVTVMYWFGVR